MEWLNEVLMMFVMYHMICFTPFMSDFKVQYYMGFSVILFVILHLVVNMSIVLKKSYKALKRSYLIWNNRRTQNKSRVKMMSDFKEASDKLKLRKRQEFAKFHETGELPNV